MKKASKNETVDSDDLFAEMYGNKVTNSLKKLDLEAMPLLAYSRKGKLILVLPWKLVVWAGGVVTSILGLLASWLHNNPTIVRSLVEQFLS